MFDPILGDILAIDEMIDRRAEEIAKERGIKDPIEARMEVIADARAEQKSSVELKPCPFCGGKADYSKIDTSETVPFGTVQHFITCKNNCLEGLYARGNTKEEAISKWNSRPSPWHTGVPTEEGFYVVTCKGWKIPFYNLITVDGGELSYIDEHGDCQEFLNEIIAYQKIEPYKGE